MMINSSTTINNNSIGLPTHIFLFGLFLKQFYILPSGSFQIGDIVIILGCLCILIITCHGKISIQKEEYIIILYVCSIVIINLYYNFSTKSSDFSKPILYYIYNIIVIVTLSTYFYTFDVSIFLNKLAIIAKVSYFVQLVLFISGIGRWPYSTRYSGSFNDPNQYGVYIFFSMLIIYYSDNVLGNGNWKWWCIIGSFLILPSTSTGTMLGLLFFWGGLYLAKYRVLNNKGRLIWGFIILLSIIIIILLKQGDIPLPSVIQHNRMYARFVEKVMKVTNAADTSSLFSDRGWTRIVQEPFYLLFGAGEGQYNRFGTSLEIHSSFIGPLFYYGILPFILMITWMIKKVKKTRYIYIYISLFVEGLFLANTRQPLFWILYILTYAEMIKGNIEK